MCYVTALCKRQVLQSHAKSCIYCSDRGTRPFVFAFSEIVILTKNVNVYIGQDRDHKVERSINTYYYYFKVQNAIFKQEIRTQNLLKYRSKISVRYRSYFIFRFELVQVMYQ